MSLTVMIPSSRLSSVTIGRVNAPSLLIRLHASFIDVSRVMPGTRRISRSFTREPMLLR